MNPPRRTRLFSFPAEESAVGRVHFGGFLRHGSGTGLRGFRRYGMYAAVFVHAGSGIYGDTRGTEVPLTAGDGLIVFPDLGHHYGPRPGEVWDEVFVAFSGPSFDAWRAHGLDPSQPVWRIGEPGSETPRLLEILSMRCQSPADMCHTAARVHEMLADWVARRPSDPTVPPWLEPARQALASFQEKKSVEAIARQGGFHPDSFRKAFARLTGESPSAFRRSRRLELARDLLHRGDLTLAQIAETLGFYDVFHFSKLFKRRYGITPARFRKLPPEPSGKIIRPIV